MLPRGFVCLDATGFSRAGACFNTARPALHLACFGSRALASRSASCSVSPSLRTPRSGFGVRLAPSVGSAQGARRGSLARSSSASFPPCLLGLRLVSLGSPARLRSLPLWFPGAGFACRSRSLLRLEVGSGLIPSLGSFAQKAGAVRVARLSSLAPLVGSSRCSALQQLSRFPLTLVVSLSLAQWGSGRRLGSPLYGFYAKGLFGGARFFARSHGFSLSKNHPLLNAPGSNRLTLLSPPACSSLRKTLGRFSLSSLGRSRSRVSRRLLMATLPSTNTLPRSARHHNSLLSDTPEAFFSKRPSQRLNFNTLFAPPKPLSEPPEEPNPPHPAVQSQVLSPSP